MDTDADRRISRPEMAAYAGEIGPLFKETKQKLERIQRLEQDLAFKVLSQATRTQQQAALLKLQNELHSQASRQAHLQALERIALDRRWNWWHTWYRYGR